MSQQLFSSWQAIKRRGTLPYSCLFVFEAYHSPAHQLFSKAHVKTREHWPLSLMCFLCGSFEGTSF